MYPNGQFGHTGSPKEAKELTQRRLKAAWPPKPQGIDASFDGYTGPTAKLSRYKSLLDDPAHGHATSFIPSRMLGPELGWLKPAGEPERGFRRLVRVSFEYRTAVTLLQSVHVGQKSTH